MLRSLLGFLGFLNFFHQFFCGMTDSRVICSFKEKLTAIAANKSSFVVSVNVSSLSLFQLKNLPRDYEETQRLTTFSQLAVFICLGSSLFICSSNYSRSILKMNILNKILHIQLNFYLPRCMSFHDTWYNRKDSEKPNMPRK